MQPRRPVRARTPAYSRWLALRLDDSGWIPPKVAAVHTRLQQGETWEGRRGAHTQK